MGGGVTKLSFFIPQRQLKAVEKMQHFCTTEDLEQDDDNEGDESDGDEDEDAPTLSEEEWGTTKWKRNWRTNMRNAHLSSLLNWRTKKRNAHESSRLNWRTNKRNAHVSSLLLGEAHQK
mmetsp:Transcript_2640/g.4266  ORF Transcript_2640/g.4266 Transcript_2640/m.4266 type:complete len:119 (-) Transcript_2640:40-396(-)